MIGSVSSSRKSRQPRVASNTRWYRFRTFLRAYLLGYTVYVLRCEDDKYYVGSTLYCRRRYGQHFGTAEDRRGERGGASPSSSWTRMYKPLEVVEEYKRIPERYHVGEENRVTAMCMLKYGVNNVRGGMFVKVRDYTLADLEVLTGFLGHYNHLNFRELEKQLADILLPDPNNNANARRTKRQQQRQRQRRTPQLNPNVNDAGGGNSFQQTRARSSSSFKANDVCYNCGQRGHWSNDCTNYYALQRGGGGGSTRYGPINAAAVGDNPVVVCYNCGLEGHVATFCPEAVICYNCGGSGHVAADCPEAVVCFNCKKRGHRQFECPELF